MPWMERSAARKASKNEEDRLESSLDEQTMVANMPLTEVAHIVHELTEAWREKRGDGVYRATTFTIDLNKPSGRCEMLVLSTLRAAQVRDDVVERTFLALRQNDLIRPERLSAATDEDRHLVLRILRTQYRAVTSKVSKVEALYNNQAHLNDHWDGDVHNIYLQYAGDDTGLIKALQNLSHLKNRAFWLAREMKVQGLWPRAGTHATEFYDSHVRRVLQRVGLVLTDMSVPWQAARQECENWVRTWFDSDVIPLYLHGSRLCIHKDRDVCMSTCPVKEKCSFWTG